MEQNNRELQLNEEFSTNCINELGDKENSSKNSNSCKRERINTSSHYFDEMSKIATLKKTESYSTDRIEIVRVEIPIRENFTKEKLAKIETIHDEHLKEVRNHFLSRINKLEKRLEKSQNILKEKDSILNKFRVELQMEYPQSPINPHHKSNLSKSSSGDSRDGIQIDLSYQFEKQLEEMRLRCNLEVDTTKAQCSYDIEQQKFRYEQYLEEIKTYYQQEREILYDRIKRLQEELDSFKGSNVSSIEESFCSESELTLTQLVEQIARINKDYSDLKIKHSQDTMRYLKEK